MKPNWYLKVVLTGAMSVTTLGCANNTQNGALIGGLGGAAIGAGIGSVSRSSAGVGALIGGAVGALGGALVGNTMDESEKKDREREEARDIRTVAPSPQSTQVTSVTKEDVMTWSSRGLRDDIIIDRIERSRTVFHLTAADENKLRDAGISEQVIQAMKNTARQ